MSSVLTRPAAAGAMSSASRRDRAASLLPPLLGALVGVCGVKIALLSGATAGLETRWGWFAVAWGGKLGGLVAGAALGWVVGRACRRPTADL